MLSDSRIEWVWLHWSEYLKAHEEFGLWLEKMHRSLEPLLEMQLGLQEKLWQVDHLRVLHSDIQGQAQFLERLLDEAAALFNRTEDPSVDEQTQQGLQDAYNHIQDRAQVNLPLFRPTKVKDFTLALHLVAHYFTVQVLCVLPLYLSKKVLGYRI